MFRVLKVMTLTTVLALPQVQAQEQSPQSEPQAQQAGTPEELIAAVTKGWDASKWGKEFRGKTYMRPAGEPGWKLRMATLRSLVLQGQEAVPALTSALDSKHAPTRVLAAQALSYLAPTADLKRLRKTLTEDKDMAARLYAVDALGMSGKGKMFDWAKIAKSQNNRDVNMHLKYAQERGGNAVSGKVIETMKKWKPSQMDTAKVGSPAPDFRLKTLEGKEVALSDFRGKQPVVLVFIYGDT